MMKMILGCCACNLEMLNKNRVKSISDFIIGNCKSKLQPTAGSCNRFLSRPRHFHVKQPYNCVKWFCYPINWGELTWNSHAGKNHRLSSPSVITPKIVKNIYGCLHFFYTALALGAIAVFSFANTLVLLL